MTTETKKPSERITVNIPMSERAFRIELSGPAICDNLGKVKGYEPEAEGSEEL